MGLVIKKTIVPLILFLIIPLSVITVNWQWQPTSINNTSKYLFWVTETASFPWAIITSGLFFLLFYLKLVNKNKKTLLLLWLVLVSAMLGGQIIKSIIKQQTAEARPYVIWLDKEFNLNQQQFYSQARAERKANIEKLLANSTIIPRWLSNHWQNETGYAFPSGHTLFAVTWALLAIILLSFKRHFFIVSIITIWSLLIETSRLLLGMHSAYDLILGILLAWLISLICCFYVKKWHIVME
ncbi:MULTISPECIES: phosphatase PAP2 family protein [Gilliamella]|uniref:undecaprenyl-diphosphate phosphatase n=1 Tax=Gilliamella apis TaxID=1970738 RepID=A0A2V4E8M2_9GAMM|nr:MULTISPECIES: phosphatase PAP2 family protein [Gilliamella]MBI0038114.1 phosphatase PAP2 family protein [Gilliamella sp. B14384G10]MBI0040109.1 phosphatase PAP2 family protein [Gilliamella sp. B14384G7]MBI0051949.1 phosphatase PAP2 family protein [Gilliamella sp. B14384G13]MBI0054401.1 phosphatase PAP2 family protein [Gilliamella sp. B14384H2]PXY90483.1 phosphatidylglycerophosphatase B [Gilliamella apis]